MKANTLITSSIILAILLIIIGITIFFNNPQQKSNQFQNPSQNNTSSNVIATSTNGISFEYEKSIDKKYMDLIDWPPQVQIIKSPYVCETAGKEIDRAGKTEEIFINNNKYCKTSVREGAAGSTYTQYAYMVPKENMNIIFTFSTREVQCLNYDNPQQTECLNEQKSFNIDALFDKIAQSIVIQ